MYSPEPPLEVADTKRVHPGRRFALKAATDAAHARVEGIVQSAGMLDSMEGYRRYLSATWLLRSRFEGLLDRSGAAQLWPEWPKRRIAQLVARDLSDLNASLPANTEKPCVPLGTQELLAVLYVLEGSSLGARLLVRSVGSLGLSADYGARHLHAHAGDVGAWRSFVGLLEASPLPPCHATAIAVFDAFADTYAQAAR